MKCPYCHNDDPRLLESIRKDYALCAVCSKTFEVKRDK